MTTQGIRLTAALVFLGYEVLVFTLLGGGWAVRFVLWASLPLALPLTAALIARTKRTQLLALGVLLCLAIVGAVLLIWGLAWNRATTIT